MAFPSLPISRFARSNLFQPINLKQPRLKLIHERPFLFLIPDFLTLTECAALRAKAQPALMPQSFDDEAVTHKRTSNGCTLRNEEVPTLRDRFARLANVAHSQLQASHRGIV